MLKRTIYIVILIIASVTVYADDALQGYEYWIDSDYSKRTVSNSSQTDVSFSIDLSSQEQGLHALNFRARSSDGQWGSLKRMLYYIPEVPNSDNSLSGYEYWLDNEANMRVSAQNSSETQALSIDISQMTQGIHFFNFRAHNTNGDMGMLKRFLFYIPETASADATVTLYEYWLDDDLTQKVTRNSHGGDFTVLIDVSQLTAGVHFYNFRAKNSDGIWGALKRMLFFVPETVTDDATVSRYEYWIDDDPTQKVSEGSSEGNVVKSIDVSMLEAGIHFLSFRAQNSEGIWGALKRFLFYMPEPVNENSTITQYEYWIDDDQSQKITENSTGNDVTAMLDISQLTEGVHFYNFRAKNSEGIWSALKRMLFYVPETINNMASVAQYEYWIDDDYSKKVAMSSAGGDINRMIDISTLESGIHYLNFRAQNSDGIWGALKRMLFYVPETGMDMAELTGYEYWFDDDRSTLRSIDSNQTNQVFTLDISALEPGVHYLSYRARNSLGVWGALKRLVFYLSDGSETIGDPLVAYLYRFNSTTTEVPIPACQSYTMDNQVFEIPDAEEFLKVDPQDVNCKFSFPTGDATAVTMTQTSNVSFSIQFKNSRDVLSSPVNADFSLSNIVSHDVESLKKQGSLTFKKVSGGDFYAFKFESEGSGSPLYIKANQACTIALFDVAGNLSVNPLDSAAVKNTASLQNYLQKGTYYGIVYNMVKNAGNSADDITIRLMTTNNMVPTPQLAYEDGKVTISCLQEGAQLYYTTDGKDPTPESTPYTSPIPVEHNMTVKAIGTFIDMQTSDVASLVIDTFTVSKPVIQFANLQIHMSCATPQSSIYYTLDGSDPTGTGGLLYTGPVPVTSNCTVKAVAKRIDFNNSEVVTFELDVNNVKVATPEFTIAGNVITVASLTNDVQLVYTLDGSEPNETSTPYSGSITLEHNCIVKVKAYKAGHLASETATLVVDWFYAELPVMSVSEDETTLTITCSTPGAVIHYEIGGAVPTEESPIYESPLILTDNRVVKAIAIAPNFNNSEVATFQPGTHACEPAVIASNGRTATISTKTQDARIYYTTNGASPNEGSLYVVNEGVIVLDESTWTIKTLVVKENMNNSTETMYNVPAYYDNDAKVLYTHEAGNAANGFIWSNGINNATEMSVSGSYNAADIEFFRKKMPNMKHLDLRNATIVNKELADSAFADMKNLMTIVTPIVQKVGNGILAGCNHLAAVTWTSDINVPEPDLLLGGVSGHENMLLYVKSNSYAPASYRNVISSLNGTAESITLTDGGGDFYCPLAFTARRISYTHSYNQKIVTGVCRGWESIALPFDVQTYTHAVNGTCAPFAQENANAKPFWLCELSTSGFVRTDGIKANTPYIIAMPNNDNYADAYILAGVMTFAAENARVAASDKTEERTKDGFMMYVNYGQPKYSTEHIYALNVGEEYQGHPEGSMFVRNLRALQPFECYVSSMVLVNSPTYGAEPNYFKLFDDSETVGISDIPMKDANMQVYVQNGKLYVEAEQPSLVKVCNLNGQTVKTDMVPRGITCIDGLISGIYIVNGKKFAVR